MRKLRPVTEAAWAEQSAPHGWRFLDRIGVESNQARYLHIGTAETPGCGKEQTAFPVSMRKGQVACSHCERLAWEIEAQEQGWRFIDKPENLTAVYEHVESPDGGRCGFQKSLRPSAMKLGKVQCDACQEREWREDAAGQGWEFVSKKGKSGASYRHVEYEEGVPCGAAKTAQPSAMKKGQVLCRECQIRRWKEDAATQGWEFVRKAGKSTALYRHLEYEPGMPCGETKQLQPGAMQLGRVRCDACQVRRWKDEAADQGWEFLRKIDKTKAEYRHLARPDGSPCGEMRSAQMTHLRHGRVRCQKCPDPGQSQRAPQHRSGHLERWKAAAMQLGWELIDKVDGERGLYRHLKGPGEVPCLAEKEILAASMQAGYAKCDACLLRRWHGEALEAGWELLEKLNGNRGSYRHLQKPNGQPCGTERIADAASMRRRLVRCLACDDAETRWRAEAEKNGWELIEKVDGNQGVYRHLLKNDKSACGAEKTADAASMRRGRVRCDSCTNVEERWRREAELRGWSLVEKLDGDKGRYVHVRKANGDPCGAPRTADAASMRIGNVRCRHCQSHLLKWAEDAAGQGWTLLEQVDGYRGRYRHQEKADGTPCLHEQVMFAQSVRLGFSSCDGCDSIEQKWAREAAKHGWELLRKVDGNQGSYKHLWKADGSPCGHEMTCDAASMRLGTVRCTSCCKANVSVLHQNVRGFLTELFGDDPVFDEEVMLGLTPALVEGENDGPARVDFLVRKEPHVVVEIDGQQHFKYVAKWHRDPQGFKRQVFRDVFVEGDARNQGMLVLRFGSWETLALVKEVLWGALKEPQGKHRLAEHMVIPDMDESFWDLRTEGRAVFAKRMEEVGGSQEPSEGIRSVGK